MEAGRSEKSVLERKKTAAGRSEKAFWKEESSRPGRADVLEERGGWRHSHPAAMHFFDFAA